MFKDGNWYYIDYNILYNYTSSISIYEPGALAVYTKLDTENFKIILSQYDIGELVEFAAITAGVENTNYSLKTTTGKFILTVFEKRVNKKDLPFYLNLVNYLEEKQFPCPKIYQTKNGALLFNHQAKTGVIVSFLEGHTVESEISEIHCAKLGKILAHMHLLTDDFSYNRQNDFNLDGIKKFYQQLRLKNIIKPEHYALFDSQLCRLSDIDYSRLPKGIIHADLFPDNVFFTNNLITGVLDFYFACNDYFICDLAICINAWCFDNKGEYQSTLASSIIHHYNKFRKISLKEISLLKDFCILMAIRFYFTRLYDSFFYNGKDLVEVKDPEEYFHKIYFFKELTDFTIE